MDDTAQKPPTDPSTSSGQVKPVQAPTIVAPTPISAPNREHEPAPFPDVTKMTEAEIQKEEKEVEKEIEAIAEKSPKDQRPVLDEEIKRVGVALSEEDVKEPSVSIGDQPLPMTFNQAQLTKKKYSWRNSISWLATLVMYHWKKLNSKEI